MSTYGSSNVFFRCLQNVAWIRKNAAKGLVAVVLFSSLSHAYQQSAYCQKGPDTCVSGNTRMGSTHRIPSAYIPHGGGPLPILGDKKHVDMVKWLNKFVDTYLTGEKKPTSVLVVSAHWEAKQATVQSGDTTSLYYDYYGFPDESYNLDYTLEGAKTLSKRVSQLLQSSNIPHKIDNDRGFDHGVFIPMKIMYPAGGLPTIQISLVAGLDPEQHIKLGEALAPLREEGVFILGSGMSYHNMRGFSNPASNKDSEVFHEYLRSSLLKAKTYEERAAALKQWATAPKARSCHPREEHLIPLMVILGTSKNDRECVVTEPFFADVAGVKCSGYVFQ